MLVEFFIFLFGATVGSFLNVCICRLPQGKSVVWPGSHCPHCEKRIPGYDNIPFLSYILLKGRCRFCQQKISFEYFLVELLSATIFVVLFRTYGLSYDFLFYMVFICALIIATFVDLKHRIIPDEISLGCLIFGFILSSTRGITLSPFRFYLQPLLNSLWGILAGGGSIYLSGALFDLVYFKLLKKPPIQGHTQSMGAGDVKLLAMIGAFLGWQRVVLTFFLAPFFGAVVGGINLLFKRDHTLAYGPFLSLASLISLFWSNKILSFIFAR